MNRLVRRAVAVGVLLMLTSTPARPQEPLPLDPLTPRERELASTIARDDSRIREFLRTRRSRQIYVDFIAVKLPGDTDAQRDEPSRRYAEVLFYRYEDDLGARALVDLAESKVIDVVRVSGRSVPVNVEEVEEAARLALADPAVIRLFGEKMPPFRVATRPATREDVNSDRIEGLRTIGSSPSDPCFRHRCVALFFRSNNRYLHMNRVVVDLTSQKVLVLGGDR